MSKKQMIRRRGLCSLLAVRIDVIGTVHPAQAAGSRDGKKRLGDL